MSDINITEALNEIRKAGRMFRAFEHVEKVLTAAAGLEQNERELLASVGSLKHAQESAMAALLRIQEDAKQTTDAAVAKAERIGLEADMAAKRVRDAADKYDEDTRRDLEAAVKEAAANCKKSMDMSVQLSHDIAAGRAELDDLNKKIAKARAAAAAIVKEG